MSLIFEPNALMSLVIGVDGERCRREGGGDGGACVGWVIGEMFLFLPILARLFLINHACYYDYRNTQKNLQLQWFNGIRCGFCLY